MKKEKRPIVLAVGFFDGLHKGHQKVIRKTVENAQKCKGTAWMMSFEKHPMKILKPDAAPLLLSSHAHKLELVEKLSIDGCLFLPFTRRFAQMKPESFIKKLQDSIPTLKEIVVGNNWRFGREGQGDTAMLVKLMAKAGIKVNLMGAIRRKGKPISSTRIRAAVAKGQMEEATTMLGRPFSILGTVIKGKTLGRKLGFPTANLAVDNEILPPRGAYAVHAILRKKVYNGVLNLGFRPTVEEKGKKELSIELHILDFKGDLYGKDIEVFFLNKLRNERLFRSLDALKRQISMDIEKTRKMLNRKKLKESLYI